MKGKHLRSLLKVIPKNNIRYFLNGLYVNFDYREIAATDGHILVLLENLEELNIDGTGEAIIPRNVIEAATSVCDPNANVYITNTEISIGDLTIKYKPIEGKYPDFRVVFPKKETTYEDSRFCWFQSEFVKIVEKIAKDYAIDFEFFPPENEKTSPLKLTGVSSDCSAFVTILLCKMDVDINGKNKFKRSFLDGKTYFKD